MIKRGWSVRGWGGDNAKSRGQKLNGVNGVQR